MENAKIKEVSVISVCVRKKLITRHSLARRGGSLVTAVNGMTLIELVIGMVLIGIVALVVANALSTGITGFFVVDNRKEALDQARIAMDRMAKEMRNVRSLADIGTASANQFCFLSTDGTTRVSFLYSGTTIVRDEPVTCPSAAVTPVLANNITAFKFKNPDGTDLDAATLATTKRIMITITSTAGSENLSLQTEVWPRNL